MFLSVSDFVSKVEFCENRHDLDVLLLFCIQGMKREYTDCSQVVLLIVSKVT